MASSSKQPHFHRARHEPPRIKIGPSVLNSDLSCLADESRKMIRNGADYIHLDVMDGHFVDNFTFGHGLVKSLRAKMPDVFFDLHMMVAEPNKWIAQMADAGATQYCFHYETSDDVGRTIRRIREHSMQVGVAIKPRTPVDVLFPYLDDIDMALVMSVEPGFGGQKFMSDMMPKIRTLRERCASLDIEVDGGVDGTTVKECARAGANMIVSGRAIVDAPDWSLVIRQLREASEKERKHHWH